MIHTRGSATVLVADDDPDDRLITRRAFEQSGMAADLRFVEDGEELLDYLKRRGRYADPTSSPRPDLLLLDLNMPKKDGWEALREMKADPALRLVRVVVLTTSRAREEVRLAYDVSVTSFISKPPSFAELVGLVRVLAQYWLETVERLGGD